jgi:hypothetical protein
VLPDDDHRSKHVGAFKCFNVCFRIIQYILVHLLVLIISDWNLVLCNVLKKVNKIIFTPRLRNRKGYLRENHIII